MFPPIRLTPLILLVVALALTACVAPPDPPQADSAERQAASAQDETQPAPKTVTLFVDASRVPCVGVAPQECYRVREAADGEWQLFYDEIDGFVYEPGFVYELRVAVTPVENPPADASSLRYELVELVSQTPVSDGSGTSTEYTGVWSARLPAASSPGREIVLTLGEDGEATLSSDFLNGEPPIVEVGSWQLDEAGTATVTLQGREELAYDAPVVMTFAREGDGLVAVAFDESRFGAAGLRLQAGTPTAQADAPLADTAWQLAQIQMMNDELFTPVDPAAYTLVFEGESRFSGQADCNRISGAYASDGSSLSLTKIASTRAMCPPNSLYDRYLQALDAANSFVLADGQLHIAFGPDSGILTFTPLAE